MSEHCDNCCGHECDGAETFPAARRVREWLERQRIKPGGVSREVQDAVELLAEDLDAGDA